MQLDRGFYEKCILEFKDDIKEIFGENIIEISEEINLESRGCFELIFYFKPLKYKIIIENEIRTFDITIEDEENASNSLYRIEHFENVLGKKNIFTSIILLKNVLEENNFNFYFHKENKLYRKNKNGVRRVKDLRELING